MESVSAGELLIEEGKSSELIAAFQALQETTVDDGPKYMSKTCRELARAISCRSYGKSMLEVTYLLIIACACDRRGGRFEEFLWNSGPARPSSFRGYVQDSLPLARGTRLVDNGVAVDTDTESFTVTFSRMPFLSAFVEFLMTTIGYTDLDEITAPLRGDIPTRETIGEVTNGLARCLYDYLREHLPSAHNQRKTHLLVDFINARQKGRSGPDDVSDEALLAFWVEQSGEGEDGNDFRTYQSVFQAGVELRHVMSYALDKYRMSGAKSIGTDVEAGEVDPGDIEDATEALDALITPLATLADAPFGSIKFLNGRETETAAEIALGPGMAIALSRSVFRNAVFGRAQGRITNALRHKRLSSELLADAAETDYPARLENYHDLAGRLDRSLLAVLHVLAMDRNPQAIILAMAMRPDLDFGLLAEETDAEPEWQDASVVSISAVRAAERFFERAGSRSSDGDPIGELMAEARKAFRSNSRQGFTDEDMEDDEVLESFADAVTPLLALRREVAAFLKSADVVDWSRPYEEDREVFTRQFHLLYGGHHGD